MCECAATYYIAYSHIGLCTQQLLLQNWPNIVLYLDYYSISLATVYKQVSIVSWWLWYS